MATPSSPALKRSQAARGHHNFPGNPSPRRGRRGSAVTFDETTSIFRAPAGDAHNGLTASGPDLGTLRSEPEEEEEEELGGTDSCYACSTLMEKPRVRKFFQICAVINLLSLMFSAPLNVCEPDMQEDCNRVFIQYTFIAAVDFVLSMLYTVQLVLVVMALCSHARGRKLEAPPTSVDWLDDDLPIQTENSWRSCIRLVSLLFVFISLWYSVAIGIYRSYVVMSSENVVLEPYYYFPLVLRSLVSINALKLFVPLWIPTSSLSAIWVNIKHRKKQLIFVAIFYFFFIYVYALVGVQWLGGLTERCFYQMEDGSFVESIPATHCNTEDRETAIHNCYNDQNMICRVDDSNLTGSSDTNINYRNTVYLGQFRFILDAVLAVYEVSSWELWSFMEYNAFNGASRNIFYPAVYYITMVFLLLLFQGIFLVVIIESFADLRSNEAGEGTSKKEDKPTIVLYEQRGGNNEISFKHIKKQESLALFKRKLDKYYYNGIEKVFIVLVLLDAVVAASKRTEMDNAHIEFLRIWQCAVSILFVLEVVGLFIFHLLAMPMQLFLFLKTRYFWYLIIIAVGGFIGGLPVISINDPSQPGRYLAIFQAVRLFRAVHLVPAMKKFVFKILGDGARLIIVVLIVVVFLVWFAVVNMQLFGYVEPRDHCERLGSDSFRDFFHAFQSMFQLLMQEGWSQLYSEIMCRHNVSFIFINIYFILLHLVSSLILLNFFVAVILDNLDYDEDVKKKKLEEAAKNIEKIQTVPYHLKIFQSCGPKKVPVPKISSVAAPNLTEADVRNFYNVGEATDFPSGFVAEQPPVLPSEMISHRRTSELSNLNLLTAEDSGVGAAGGLSAHQGKYWGVQGILSYIKAYRQQSRENEWARPGQSARGGADFLGGARGPSESAAPLASEYDEYREKYRLFDSALFLLPPEHKFRRLCCFILDSKLQEPSKFKSERRSVFMTLLLGALYIARYVVSSLPYFTWVMIAVTMAALCTQISEIFITSADVSSTLPFYIWWMDLIFVVFTLLELILKIFAHGFFFNPHAAIQSVWDVIDWVIVLSTLVVMVVYVTQCGCHARLDVSTRNLPWWMVTLLTLRAFRPLRLISLVPGLRHVFYELFLGWRKLVLALILLFFFIFFFASLGVQFFSGQNSPEGFCNDPTKENPEECVGQFSIVLEISLRESLPLAINGSDTSLLVPRVWYRHRRDYRFDSWEDALLTLFEVLTLEGWLDVRNLFDKESDVTRDSEFSWLMFLYVHIFVFVGVNLVLQLFLGIVVNNFNEHKPNQSALLTVSQKRWTDLLQRITLTRPIKKPPPPRDNKFRLFLYKVFLHNYYKHLITLVILLNSTLLYSPWVDNDELGLATRVEMSISVAFAGFFILEVLLKLVAFGPRKYFQSWRFMFDFGVSLLGFCYLVLAIVYLVLGPESGLELEKIADAALVFAVLKLFTILMKNSILQSLLSTVGVTLFHTSALLVVLMLILLFFTFIGNLHFGIVRTGEAVDFGIVNFRDVLRSLNLLIRVVTGEDWHTIFRDAMVKEPYCSSDMGDCGNPIFAVIYFLTFYIGVSFIFLNVIYAVLLENFSIFYNDDDTEVNHAVVRDFKQNWLFYDKNASGLISSEKLKLFLRMLKLKDFYTYITFENGIKERQRCSLLTDSILLREMAEELHRGWRQQGAQQEALVEGAGGGNQPSQEGKGRGIPFQDVLKMLAYRSEDISQRLVPHQLYVREELETSVQFDVAEQCILKWIKKFVSPVITKQEKHRRHTVSHNVYRAEKRGKPPMWTPLISSEGREEEEDLQELQETSEEEEEEVDHLKDSMSVYRQTSIPHKEEEDAEMQTLDSDLDRLNDPHLVKSYIRLESAPFLHFSQPSQGGGATGGGDKWHEWVSLQKDWMSKVEENPENYFDDCL